VLLGQSNRTPHGAVIDEYGAMVKLYICRGNRSTRRKPAQCHLSTTNPTWIDPVANPGLRGERPATNRLSHGTTLTYVFFQLNVLLTVYEVFEQNAYKLMLWERLSPPACVCNCLSARTFQFDHNYTYFHE
jgi:hypothetical protein